MALVETKFNEVIVKVRSEILNINSDFRSYGEKTNEKTSDSKRKIDGLQKIASDQSVKLTKFTGIITLLEDQIYRLNEKAATYNSIFEEKTVVAELLRRFNVFSDIECIQELREVMLPRVKAFSENVDKLYESNE